MKMLIEEEEKSSYDPVKLAESKKKIEKLISKYKKIEINNEKLLAINNKKTVGDVFAEKETELDKQLILREFVQSNKSAAEIYQELRNKGDKISFEDVIGAIRTGAQGYLLKNDIDFLIDREKSIFSDTLRIEAWNSKKEKAQKKDDESRAMMYEEKIKRMQESVDIRKRETAYNKNTLSIRLGLTRQNGLDDSGEVEEKSGEQDVDAVKEQQESSDNNQIEISELKVEQIKTTSGIIPNVKAIAKKGRVTKTSLKEVFSKISRLNKEKSSISKTTDGNRANDKDVEQDMV